MKYEVKVVFNIPQHLSKVQINELKRATMDALMDYTCKEYGEIANVDDVKIKTKEL